MKTLTPQEKEQRRRVNRAEWKIVAYGAGILIVVWALWSVLRSAF